MEDAYEILCRELNNTGVISRQFMSRILTLTSLAMTEAYRRGAESTVAERLMAATKEKRQEPPLYSDLDERGRVREIVAAQLALPVGDAV